MPYAPGSLGRINIVSDNPPDHEYIEDRMGEYSVALENGEPRFSGRQYWTGGVWRIPTPHGLARYTAPGDETHAIIDGEMLWEFTDGESLMLRAGDVVHVGRGIAARLDVSKYALTAWMINEQGASEDGLVPELVRGARVYSLPFAEESFEPCAHGRWAIGAEWRLGTSTSISGVWQSEGAEEFPFRTNGDETHHVLEGSLTVTVAGEAPRVARKGDILAIRKDVEGTWNVSADLSSRFVVANLVAAFNVGTSNA
ncbi:cupin domain-containing protein [Sphingobium nicotianae]|uniref:DUF861 domain-containing protein n=1 Tax=Sphingobium nicotianae TaxID=2782607 RepID=A0A9X1D9T6_9SPHN|nr:cupin domain-containing protein [Sphingobium nicotianae]MBT2186039.1 DUF861 domain-containing protein [Sphingobium nicotianae]